MPPQRNVPLRRREIAYAARFLASDEASNINGAEPAVNGGYIAM